LGFGLASDLAAGIMRLFRQTSTVALPWQLRTVVDV